VETVQPEQLVNHLLELAPNSKLVIHLV